MQRPKLSKHWLINYKEQAPILNDVEVPPSIGIISGWAKQKKCDFIWMPWDQNNILYENNFFCSKCKKFLSVGGSIGNVKRHQLFHSKKETVVITENIPLSQDTKVCEASTSFMNMLSQHLQAFILLNGLPFSHIEDEFLRKVCPILPTREKIVKELESISLSVENYIMKKIVDYDHISIAYDDWTDGNQRRFLGITAQCVKGIEIKSFTLALCPLLEKATGDYLNFLVIDVLKKYQILDKVKVAVTDCATNMICSSKNLPFPRLPCICHVLNTLIGAFLDGIQQIIAPILKVQNDFSTPNFILFLEKNKSEKRRIPSYCKVRWYSLCNMFTSLRNLKDLIIAYGLLENTEVPYYVWETIEELYPLLTLFEKVVKKLESDCFGTISYILKGLSLMKNEILKLPGRYLKGVDAYLEKERIYWRVYSNHWDPLLFSATRLNPSLDINTILSPEEIIRGDKMIESMIVSLIPPNCSQEDQFQDFDDPFTSSHVEKNNNCFVLAFDEYKTLKVRDLPSLLDFWNKRDSNESKYLNMVAIDILSILVSSASAERQFSKSKYALSDRRLSMTNSHVEDLNLILGNKEIAEKFILK